MTQIFSPASLSIRLPAKAGIQGNVAETEWSNGKKTATSAFFLRMSCPCATCRETGGPRGVPTMVEISDFSWVGNYAVNFLFSDGHKTGIYTYSLLNELDESKNNI